VIDIIDINELINLAGELIRDRTQYDVDYALFLERNMTYTDENLKGAYNISDRNRVGGAVNYIADCLRNTGRHEVRTKIRDDWDIYDIIKPEDNEKVLAALVYLKYHLPYDETENVPQSMDNLTYQKANTAENILFDLYGAFERLHESWFYSGEAFASEFDVWNWQGWDIY
jgi:hypothetical protein